MCTALREWGRAPLSSLWFEAPCCQRLTLAALCPLVKQHLAGMLGTQPFDDPVFSNEIRKLMTTSHRTFNAANACASSSSWH
jgi:hypothetical protein